MRASDGAHDKFYTKPEIAAAMVALIPDMDSYVAIVEPSAGNGSFLRLLPKRAVGYDIAPEAEGIQRADWLRTQLTPESGLMVGNPPFGARSSLAKAFIRHGIGLGFETIAFILPQTFRKLTTQRCFPEGWRLIVEVDLPDDAFFHEKGDVHIPCVFQVWTRRPGGDNLRKAASPQPDAYAFLPRGDGRADICLNGNSGRVRAPDAVSNPKAEHYIKILRDEEATLTRLRGLPLDFRSSVSGGVAWVSKADINAAWWASSPVEVGADR